MTDKKTTYPVIVSNTYGRGKTILFAFDLLNSTDQSKASSLIINSINYVMPSENYTRAMEDVPVNINIQNSSEAVDVQITETLPDNTTADSITPDATQSSSTITWQATLSANEKKTLSYWLNLPDVVGDYQLGTELKYSNNGNHRLYGDYSLTLSVSLNSTDLLNQILSNLQGLSATKSDAAHVSNAIGYLSQIKDYTGITKTDVQNNINNILNALSELSKVSIDVSSIRLKLDELLKIWQMKWNLSASYSPLEKGVAGVVSTNSRYRLVYEKDARKIEKRVSACHSGACAERSRCTSGIILDSSFPRTSVGNPLPCNKPIVLASSGSSSGITTTTTVDTIYFYHTDHLGTPMIMTDSSGSTVWSGEFLPFGEEYSITGSVTNNFRFTGQYYDEETGTNYNINRTYDSNSGRYREADPIGLSGGVNLYLYAKANPINFIDPLGLTVTIEITRDTITNQSISGTISVSSDVASDTFSGYTLEPIRQKGSVPNGWYDAFLRKDYSPWRIELENVPNNTGIQIHTGNYPSDSSGCFLVGTTRSNDFVGNSVAAMNSILSIIKKDCSDDIRVYVGGNAK